MLEEDVRHADLELSELRDLALDFPSDEVTTSRGCCHRNCSLSPARLAGHDLRRVTRCCQREGREKRGPDH